MRCKKLLRLLTLSHGYHPYIVLNMPLMKGQWLLAERFKDNMRIRHCQLAKHIGVIVQKGIVDDALQQGEG